MELTVEEGNVVDELMAVFKENPSLLDRMAKTWIDIPNSYKLLGGLAPLLGIGYGFRHTPDFVMPMALCVAAICAMAFNQIMVEHQGSSERHLRTFCENCIAIYRTQKSLSNKLGIKSPMSETLEEFAEKLKEKIRASEPMTELKMH